MLSSWWRTRRKKHNPIPTREGSRHQLRVCSVCRDPNQAELTHSISVVLLLSLFYALEVEAERLREALISECS